MKNLRKAALFLFLSVLIKNNYAQLTASPSSLTMHIKQNRCFSTNDPSIKMVGAYTLDLKKIIVKNSAGPVKIAAKFDLKGGQYYPSLFNFFFQDSITTDTVGFDMVSWAHGYLSYGSKYTTTITFYEVADPSNKIDVPVTFSLDSAFHNIEWDYFKPTSHCTDYPTGLAYTNDTLYHDFVSCSIPDMISPLKTTFVPSQGQTYIDRNFGTKVTIVSEPGIFNIYSQPTAMSTNGKYLWGQKLDGSGIDNLYDKQGNKLISNIPFNMNNRGASNPMWDCYSDEYVYFIRGNTQLVRYHIPDQKDTLLIDFSLPPYNLTRLGNGGSSDLSKDNWASFIGVSAPLAQNGDLLVPGSDSVGKVVAVNLNTLQTYIGDYHSVMEGIPANELNYVMISKGPDAVSGKRYVVIAAIPSMIVYEINESTKTIDYLCRGPEDYMLRTRPTSGNYICNKDESCIATPHADTYEDSDGNQWFVGQNANNESCPQRNSVAFCRLRDGIKMREPVEYGGSCIEISFDYNGAGLSHLGASRKSPYLVVSMGSTYRTYADTSAFSKIPLEGELIVMGIINGKVKIRRIAKSRNTIYTGEDPVCGYFDQLQACISDNGDYVIFTSNFQAQKGPCMQGDPVTGRKMAIVETGYNNLTLGINKNIKKNSDFNFTITPNPGTGIYQLKFSSAFSSPVHLSLFDMRGTLIMNPVTDGQQQTLDLNNLEAGIYFLQADNNKNIITKKVVKLN